MSLNYKATLTLPVGSRDHTLGPVNAPVTLVEYGDYECSSCGRAFVIVGQLLELLAGRMCFVFRNFPLTQIHLHAFQAAESAEAASVQGRFWDMHDVLFKHQDALADRDLLQYAAWLGMDAAALAAALSTHAFKNRIREDFTSGVRSGVNGTPTFYINGVRYDGSYDLEPLLTTIEQVTAREVHLRRIR